MHTRPLALIAALARNGVIGHDNHMPWHLPADLRHFKALTLGKPVIMGRKTWMSLGRPLPGRLNLVLSRSLKAEPGMEVFGDLSAALSRAEHWAHEQGASEIMVIGGADIYTQCLPLAQRLYLTRIELEPVGDTYFPDWDQAKWRLDTQEEHAAQAEQPGFRFETWVRS